MADVGVLNLQIHDNSEQAGKGLDKLADALSRVKKAVGDGINLSGVSTHIKNIAKVVDENISGSTIAKLGEFGDALSKLKDIGNVNVNIKAANDISRMVKSTKESREAIESIGNSTSRMAEEVENIFDSRIEPSVDSGTDAFRHLREEMERGQGENTFDFSNFDPANLPFDKLGTSLNESTKDVHTYGEAVRDSFETLRDSGVFDSVTSSIENIGNTTNAIIPYSEKYETSVESICQRMKEAETEATESFDQILEKQREASEVARQINESVESRFSRQFLSREQTDEMASELTKLDLLKAQLRDARIEYNKFVNQFGAESSKTVKAGLAVQELQDKVREYLASLNEFNQTAATTNVGEQTVENYAGMSQADLLTAKYDAMKQAIIEKVNAGRMDEQQQIDAVMRLQKLGSQIESLNGQEEDATETTGRFRAMLDSLKNSIKNSPFGKLAKQFNRIIKYRAIRAVIKHISDGFREGVENVYRYSTAIGGSFASSMDSAASSLLQMKNSIGAAAAPLIESMIPYLQILVNWFIEAVNYANQFFALMRGQATWTRAVPATAKAFDKQSKAAKGASAAVKDLLADWDELNIIQSETGGGGVGSGTKSAEDYLKMFEEVSTFQSDVRNVVGFIKDNFDAIKTVAEGIGAAILAWKISSAFSNSLEFFKTLNIAAGVTLLVTGVKLSTAAGYNIGKDGINNDNLLQGIGGIMAGALGAGTLGVAFGGITGGVIGLTVGTTISLLAMAASMDQGEKDKLYGDVKMTADEIKKEVDNLFKIDVNAELTNATVDHESIEKARTDLSTSIHNMNADFVTFKLKLTTDSALALADSVGKTVDNANLLLKGFQKKISIGFGFENMYSNPEMVQKFSTDNVTGLSTYITDLGNQIGKILEDGIVDAVNEKNLLDSLMKKLENVTKAIETGRASANFSAALEEGNYQRDWTKIDRESIVEYAKQYTDAVDKVREAAHKNAVDTKSALGGIYAGMLQREMDTPGTYTEQELTDAENAYKSYNIQNATDDFVKSATEEGRKTYVKNMMTALRSAAEKVGQFDTTIGHDTLKNTNLKDWFQLNLARNLGWGNIYGDEGGKAFQQTLGTAGVSGFDMLTDQMQKLYVKEIIDNLGHNADTYKRLKDELGIPLDELLQDTAPRWKKWSTLEKENAYKWIAETYSEENMEEAMRNAGLGDYVPKVPENNTVQEAVEEAAEAAAEQQTVLPVQTTPEFVMKDGDFNITEALEADPVGVPVELKPEVSMAEDVQSNIQEATEQIQESMSALRDLHNMKEYQALSNEAQAITDRLRNTAISGGSMDDLKSAMSQIQQMYSVDAFNEAVPLLNKITQEYKEILNDNTPAVGKMPNSRTIASAGMANSGYSAWGISGTGSVSVDENQMANSVQRGTASANEPMVDNMRLILAAVRALASRPINVNLTPSAGMARMNRRSADALENVTGTIG